MEEDISYIVNSFLPLINDFDIAKEKKKEFELGFNLFSLISDTYYKENFHSDIIYSLLNPESKHNENDKFVKKFIEYLNIDNSKEISINLDDYKNPIIDKEKGIFDKRRIDILITSDKHSIIIENKINNAPDMQNQLIDYYLYCTKEKKIIVDAVIYLTLNGKKSVNKDTWTRNEEIHDEIEKKLVYISAYSDGDKKNEEKSIYGWLEKCKEICEFENNKFIIEQYQQLLKSLRGYVMANELNEKYYEEVKNKNMSESLENLVSIHKGLVNYYPNKIREEVKNDMEMKKCYRESLVLPKPYESTIDFFNLGLKTRYLLKIYFINNKKCEVRISDRDEEWDFDPLLRINVLFSSKFVEKDKLWVLKNENFDFINEWDLFVKEIKEILKLFTSIIIEPNS